MPNDLRTATGHSEYRAPGSLPRRNLVALAAGRPDLLIAASAQESRPTGGVQGPRPTAAARIRARSGTSSAPDERNHRG
jgi:hypothetical protein